MKKYKEKLKAFFNNKYAKPVLDLLKQGITPKKLALSIAGAAVLGVFPVLGSTTILCTAFALIFRLNLPIVHLVNFSVYPLQILLIVPFMNIGASIFKIEELNYTLTEMLKMIEKDIWGTIVLLWNVTMQAIGAWAIVSIFVSILLYFIFNYVFLKLDKKLVK